METPSDAEVLAQFILGWWPGLEDGMNWPGDAEHPEGSRVYVAAQRILEPRFKTGELKRSEYAQ